MWVYETSYTCFNAYAPLYERIPHPFLLFSLHGQLVLRRSSVSFQLAFQMKIVYQLFPLLVQRVDSPAMFHERCDPLHTLPTHAHSDIRI